MVQEPIFASTYTPLSSTNLSPLLKAPQTTSCAVGERSPVEVSDTENSNFLLPVAQSSSGSNAAMSSPAGSSSANDDGAALSASKADEDHLDPSAGDDDQDDDDDKGGSGKGGSSGKSRRELPAGAVATLKAWLLSPEHFTHPYPTPQDQIILMQKTGIDKKQLKNWFTNARRRIWKPMLKKQLEQGKLAATGAGGGGVAVPGVVPGLITTVPHPGDASASVGGENPHLAMHAHYQQALQQQQQQQPTGYDAYGNPSYGQQSPQSQTQPTHPGAPSPVQFAPQYYTSQQFGQQQQDGIGAPAPIASSNSIGSLTGVGASSTPTSAVAASAGPAAAPITGAKLNKADSHAVLMELFARDQELVRQATEGAKLKAAQLAAQHHSSNPNPAPQQMQQQQLQPLGNQHPMKQQGNKFLTVPSINSWPHFSSVSSLNNLATMTGVKSITNLSGADLASQGNLNKKGNLAAVKSIESMGRADSFAFLEIFFDDKSGASAALGLAGQRGSKKDRDEDNDVGLSLDADESPSSSTLKPSDVTSDANVTSSAGGAPSPAPLPADGKDKEGTSDKGNLKRSFDDAMAARGLISVSRSSEKLTDLAIPAKMQRTLSQEYLRQHLHSASAAQGQQYGGYIYSSATGIQAQQPPPSGYQQQQGSSQQYPGQHPGQQQHAGAPGGQPHHYQASAPSSATPLSDPSMSSSSVEVPSTTKCSLCHCINVDTQLRPCGHMFHGRCLKPSLTQNAVGPPKCPLDQIAMQSAVLAVPTDEKSNQSQQQSQTRQQQQHNWGSSGSLPSFQPHRSGTALSAETSGGKA